MDSLQTTAPWTPVASWETFAGCAVDRDRREGEEAAVRKERQTLELSTSPGENSMFFMWKEEG